ncbi:hypothetical protein TNCV_4612341 [Trichonephila clavipes]|nr:hypothetical protein TNCV_4612341 [Trichonephila clavipes]
MQRFLNCRGPHRSKGVFLGGVNEVRCECILLAGPSKREGQSIFPANVHRAKTDFYLKVSSLRTIEAEISSQDIISQAIPMTVLDESRSFFRVHTGYFSNIPKCIKAEFIASWACSQSSVVSSSQR